MSMHPAKSASLRTTPELLEKELTTIPTTDKRYTGLVADANKRMKNRGNYHLFQEKDAVYSDMAIFVNKLVL